MGVEPTAHHRGQDAKQGHAPRRARPLAFHPGGNTLFCHVGDETPRGSWAGRTNSMPVVRARDNLCSRDNLFY